MKLSDLLLFCAPALAQVSLKFDVLRGRDFQSAEKVPSSYRRSMKRNGIVAAGLASEGTYYNALVVIDGTEFNVQLDTGSSDLWVYSSENPYCISNAGKTSKARKVDASSEDLEKARRINTSPDYLSTQTEQELDKRDSLLPSPVPTIDCDIYGVFNTSTQEWTSDGEPFLDTYLDGTFADGELGTATVSFGNATLENFTFGVAAQANTNPILGIGFEATEASSSYFQYTNFPTALKKAGFIERTLYSLYMNSETSEGSVLFGGIDHAKYTGDLVTLPLDNIYASQGVEQPKTFNVQLSSLTLTNSGGDINAISSPVSVILDCGSTAMILPKESLEIIAKSLDAKYSGDAGFYVIDCPIGSTGIDFDFQFGDVNISIPFEDLLEAVDEAGTQCAILIGGSEDSTDFLLGDNFLQHAYVVYDLDGLQVQLAPVKNTDEEDIEMIGSEGPTASNGATASSQLTDTVSGFVSAGLSQSVTKTIASATYQAVFDYSSSSEGSTGTKTRTSTSASATASGAASSSTARNAGYKLESIGLGLLAMILL